MNHATNLDSLRILWISDIHYRNYTGNPLRVLQEYLTGFEERLKEINEKQSIDYVLLSGDIAYSGKAAEYEQFERDILERIKRCLGPGTRLLVIPGNHDVLWANSDFLEKFLKTARDTPTRNKFLYENQNDFEKLFESYSGFFNTKYPSLSLHENGSSPTGAGQYEKLRLFGIFPDPDRHVLFVMLNSAWFSLGSHFDDILLKVLRSEKDLSEKEVVDRFKQDKKLVEEYGGQIVGASIFKDVFLPLFTTYKDYIQLAVCHHPLSWMPWDEIYDKSGNKELVAIINQADILLTGHEHVPANVHHEKIYDDTLHFKAGKFLDDHIQPSHQTSVLLEGNRFSIIDLGNIYSRPFVKESRYEYIQSGGGWQPCNYPQLESKKLDKKQRTGMHADRLLRLQALVRDKKFNFVKFIRQESKEFGLEQFKVTYSEDHFRADIKTRSGLWTYIFVTSMESWKQIAKNPLQLGEDQVPNVITFIIPDFCVDEKEAREYLNQNKNKHEILKDIISLADNSFDEFKMEFFQAFTAKDIRDHFVKFMNIGFVLEVLPFYIFEKFCQP